MSYENDSSAVHPCDIYMQRFIVLNIMLYMLSKSYFFRFTKITGLAPFFFTFWIFNFVMVKVNKIENLCQISKRHISEQDKYKRVNYVKE